MPRPRPTGPSKPAPRKSGFLPNLDATETERPMSGERWVHEIKWDGYRAQAHIAGGTATVYTRNGHDWTDRYGVLAKAFEKLPCQTAILDGEVVVQDPRGVTSINLLEEALSQRQTHAFLYFAFDLV